MKQDVNGRPRADGEKLKEKADGTEGEEAEKRTDLDKDFNSISTI